MHEDQAARTAALKATQKKRLDGLFLRRQYELVTQVSPAYLQSKDREKLQTPLGSWGSNGWLVRLIKGQPVDPDDYTPETIHRDHHGVQWFFVGSAVLKIMAETYGSVEMPLSKREKVKLDKLREAMG